MKKQNESFQVIYLESEKKYFSIVESRYQCCSSQGIDYLIIGVGETENECLKMTCELSLKKLIKADEILNDIAELTGNDSQDIGSLYFDCHEADGIFKDHEFGEFGIVQPSTIQLG